MGCQVSMTREEPIIDFKFPPEFRFAFENRTRAGNHPPKEVL